MRGASSSIRLFSYSVVKCFSVISFSFSIVSEFALRLAAQPRVSAAAAAFITASWVALSSASNALRFAITAFFGNEVATGKLPGAVILIQQHGRPLYLKSFGVQDTRIDPDFGRPTGDAAIIAQRRNERNERRELLYSVRIDGERAYAPVSHEPLSVHDPARGA